MRIDTCGNRVELVCDGMEMDHAITIGSAFRTLQGQFTPQIAIEGFELSVDRTSRKPVRYSSVRLVGVYRRGYIRTLTIDVGSKLLTVGSANAVMEDIALTEIRFCTDHKKRHLIKLLTGSERKIHPHDYELRLIHAELHGKHQELLGLLETVSEGITLRHGRSQTFPLSLQCILSEVMCRRLNTLTNFVTFDRDAVDRIIGNILFDIIKSDDVSLQMHVCEAAFFWKDYLERDKGLWSQIKEILGVFRKSERFDLRLAAIVSTAHLNSIEQIGIGKDVCEMLAEAFLGDTPYLHSIRFFCDQIPIIWGNCIEDQYADSLSLLHEITGSCLHSKKRIQMLRTHLRNLKKSTRMTKGIAFEKFIECLLIQSRFFGEIEAQVSDRDLGRFDIVARLKDQVGAYPKDFPIIFEVKNEKKPAGLDATRQLTTYCHEYQYRRYERGFGILVAIGGVTPEATARLLKSCKRAMEFYTWEYNDIERFCENPLAMSEWFKKRMR